MTISIHALLAESDRPQPPKARVLKNFYPRSPCGERLEQSSSYSAYLEISIHALLAESDISVLWMVRSHPLFLSTLSLRRATYTDLNSAYGALISIHALLAESDPHCPERQ